MSLTRVQDVFVEDIYKRKQPKRHFMYSIRVHWEDGATTPIYRDYNLLLEFQERLLESDEFQQTQSQEEILSILLKGEKGKFLFRGESQKKALERKPAVEEFLKAVIRLPPVISESAAVMSFFRPFLEDLKAFECEQEEQHYSVRRRGTRRKHVYHISEPIMVEQYVAVADYTKREDSDISLKAGHVVDVIEKSDHGWWFVDLDGEVGWAPASYLEPRDGSVDDQVLEVFEKGKEETYITLVPYEPQFEDEVKLEMGVIVEVSQKNLNGWWFVQIGKTEGWVPSRNLREAVTSHHNRREKRKDAARLLLRDYSTKITGRRKTWIPHKKKKKTTKRNIPVDITKHAEARYPTKSSNVKPEFLQLSRKKDTGRGRPRQEQGVSGFSAVNEGGDTSGERISNRESGIHGSAIKDALTVVEKEIQDLPTVSGETSAKEYSNLPLASAPDDDTHATCKANNGDKSRQSKSDTNEDKEIGNTTGDDGEENKSEDCAEKVPKALNRKRFLAMGSYKKEDLGEVNLHRNVEVEVLKRQSDRGWWLVRTDSSSVGWAPSNFLERVNSVEKNVHETSGQQSNEEIDVNEVTASRDPNSGTVFQVARGKDLEGTVLSDIREGEEMNTCPEADKTKL